MQSITQQHRRLVVIEFYLYYGESPTDGDVTASSKACAVQTLEDIRLCVLRACPDFTVIVTCTCVWLDRKALNYQTLCAIQTFPGQFDC